MVDVTTVKDEMFAQQMMGRTLAFRSEADSMTVCSPANGTLSVMFPTGHAFGITMNNGVQLLIHIGVNTVEENGNGFTVLKKKQGDTVKAGDPIVTVDLKQLRKKYDMSTMLIVTDTNGHEVVFEDFDALTCGQVIGEVKRNC
jgi:PTS system glucose-specific IIA component